MRIDLAVQGSVEAIKPYGFSVGMKQMNSNGQPTAVYVSAKKVSETRWQVTYDGKILGDDRGFSTRDDAMVEARKRVDHQRSIRLLADPIYCWRPY